MHASREIMRPAKAYGELLAEARKCALLSQSQAAELAGVDQATISRWERGERQPDYGTLRKLAHAYDCRLSTLVIRNQYPSAPALDPEARLDWVRRRNAAIQGVDVDDYLQRIATPSQGEATE